MDKDQVRNKFSFFESENIIRNMCLNVLEERINNENLGIVQIKLENALNSILAADIISKEDVPPLPCANFDGIAIHMSDYENKLDENRNSNEATNIIFPISGASYAGNPQFTCPKGHAVRITCGAFLPKETDTVIPYEDFKLEDHSTNEIISNKAIINSNCNPKKGQYVRQSGSDIKKNQIVFKAQTIVTSAVIAVCAQLGFNKINVYKKPKIAILTSGDELVNYNSYLTESHSRNGIIRESNRLMLLSLIKDMNLDIKIGDVGILPDIKHTIKNSLIHSIENYDVIITIGGSSVSEKDFIKSIFSEISNILICGTKIRPGKSFLFASTKHNNETKLLFGLPGYATSVFVLFQTFIKPSIYILCGYSNWKQNYIKAKFQNFQFEKDDYTELVPSILSYENDELLGNIQKIKRSTVLPIYNSNSISIITPKDKENINNENKLLSFWTKLSI